MESPGQLADDLNENPQAIMIINNESRIMFLEDSKIFPGKNYAVL